MSEADQAGATGGWGLRIRSAIGIGLTVLILVVLARVADLAELRLVLLRTDGSRVAVALAVMVGVILLVAARWRLTLSANDVRLSLREAASIVLSASALNAVSPSKAGDLIKVYALRDRATPWVVLGSMVVERVVDIAALGLIALPAATLAGQPAMAAFGAVLIAGPLLLVPAMALLKRLPLPAPFKAKLAAFAAAVRTLITRPRLLLMLTAFGLTIWSAMILIAWLLYQAVGATPSLAQTAAALPMAILAGLSPFTLAGVGARDAALMWLLSAHATQAQSLAASLMYTAVLYWTPALCGAPLVLRTFAQRRRRIMQHG